MAKYTTEQLLKIMEENKGAVAASPARSKNEVHRFITALDIKEGKHKVRNDSIYLAFRKWSPVVYTSKSFFGKFRRYFQPNTNRNWRYYLLNYSAVQLINKVDNLRVKVK